MKFGRFRLRTLLIAVAFAALLIEMVGLGRRSRRYAAQAQAAASAETVNRNVARNSRIAASQDSAAAERIASADPAKAAALRAHAEMHYRNIPFFEAQAKNAGSKREVFERAMMRPWEGDPPDAEGLATTPP